MLAEELNALFRWDRLDIRELAIEYVMSLAEEEHVYHSVLTPSCVLSVFRTNHY